MRFESNAGITIRARRCPDHPFSDSFCITKGMKMNESSASARDALSRRRAWNLVRETIALRSPRRQRRAGWPIRELSYSKCKFRDGSLRGGGLCAGIRQRNTYTYGGAFIMAAVKRDKICKPAKCHTRVCRALLCKWENRWGWCWGNKTLGQCPGQARIQCRSATRIRGRSAPPAAPSSEFHVDKCLAFRPRQTHASVS